MGDTADMMLEGALCTPCGAYIAGPHPGMPQNCGREGGVSGLLIERDPFDPPDTYHFFWKGTLSQWAPTRFIYEGRTYTRCEQFMMAVKASLFNDAHAFAVIMATDDPAAHKAAGRTVRGFDEAVWALHRCQIVYAGNLYRARLDTAFRAALLGTGDKILVEASPRDRVWGIGFTATNALVNRPRWGLNLLGEILCLVRATVRAETTPHNLETSTP